MKVTIMGSVIGILAFGETNELIGYALFPKNPRLAAQKLQQIEDGRIVAELVTLIEELRDKGYTFFLFQNSEMARNAREKMNVRVAVVETSEVVELIKNLAKFSVEVGIAKQEAEFREWIHEVSMELAKMQVRRAIEKRDLVVVQAVQTLDDLDKTLNLFMGRIREWYGLHFPELNWLVEKHETYAHLVATLGKRENFNVENLEREGVPRFKAKRIAEAVPTSMGNELAEVDFNQVQSICKMVLNIGYVRQMLGCYLDSVMGEISPNVNALAGSRLGARLIALAGGLNSLAKMPSSTLQILGAEKALFRSLKTGTLPPKHGIIFQHPLIQEARRWQRGKVARALAGKLSIAARTDAFSGKNIGKELQTHLERRIKEIQEKYKEPPPLKDRLVRKSHRRSKGGHRS